MIILFMGLPGGGKTADVVKKVLDNIKLGRTVYTNVDGMDNDVCMEHIRLYTGLDDYELQTRLIFLTAFEVKEFWKHCKPGSLIVIDEVQKFFDNRSWASESNKEMNSWASTHRHHGFDVVLVTQHIDRIDKAVRALVEWTYEYRKITFMGSMVSQKFIKYAYSGEDVTCKPLGKNICTYDPRIFKCYQSYAGNDVKELGIMKHVNILRHPVFIILPFVLVFALYMLFGKSSLATGDLFGAQKIIKNADKAKNESLKVSLVSAAPDNRISFEQLRDDFSIKKSSKRSAVIEKSFSASTEAVAAPEIPCTVVGSIVDINDVKTIIRKCGDRVEKYIDGVLQVKKPVYASEPVLVAKSTLDIDKGPPPQPKAGGGPLSRPVVFTP